MKQRKGIVLAGGSGTRLFPATLAVSKQLMPIYDKPMIFYPLSALMLSGVREIAIITTPADRDQFMRLLGDGSQWGISLTYIEQPSPDGLAQAYILAEKFLDGAPSVMILGDNIFFGHGLPELLRSASENHDSGTIFGYYVADPERYGVVEFDDADKVLSIDEKPEKPLSNYAVTGLYYLDGSAPERAKSVKASERGELEITTLLETYLKDGLLNLEKLGRGYAWLDTGTHDSLLEAANFVRTLQSRQGLQTGCLEEVAYTQGWISDDILEQAAATYKNSNYGEYMRATLKTLGRG